jgi:hypothetical protein
MVASDPSHAFSSVKKLPRESLIVTVYLFIGDPFSKGAVQVKTTVFVEIAETGAIGFSGTKALKITKAAEYSLYP